MSDEGSVRLDEGDGAREQIQVTTLPRFILLILMALGFYIAPLLLTALIDAALFSIDDKKHYILVYVAMHFATLGLGLILLPGDFPNFDIPTPAILRKGFHRVAARVDPPLRGPVRRRIVGQFFRLVVVMFLAIPGFLLVLYMDNLIDSGWAPFYQILAIILMVCGWITTQILIGSLIAGIWPERSESD